MDRKRHDSTGSCKAARRQQSHLDVRSVADIVALLHRLCVEQGIAVLLSAHDMNPLLPVMDRIVYLANGHAASGATEEVVRSEVLGRLYG